MVFVQVAGSNWTKAPLLPRKMLPPTVDVYVGLRGPGAVWVIVRVNVSTRLAGEPTGGSARVSKSPKDALVGLGGRLRVVEASGLNRISAPPWFRTFVPEEAKIPDV